MTANYNLDHVILLLPYDYLSNPPDWITKNFTISPGGRHADGKTENRLLLFRDGTYLELIAFVNDDPEKRKGHWWDKPYGVVDYALGATEFDYEMLVQRLEKTDTGITYAPPKAGGRARPDGVELKWEVTFPKGVDRGNIPFFCTDVTPRERRVPITQENTTHPSGVLGMAGVSLKVKKERLGRLSTATAAVLGSGRRECNEYETRLPNKAEGMKSPTIRLHERNSESDKELALTLVLQTEEHESREDIREAIGDGVVSITFE
jgi:hypothetical protein